MNNKKIAILTSEPRWYSFDRDDHGIDARDEASKKLDLYDPMKWIVEIIVIDTNGMEMREWEKLRGVELLGIHIDRSAKYGRNAEQTISFCKSRVRTPRAPIRPVEPELPLWVQFKQVLAKMFKFK